MKRITGGNMHSFVQKLNISLFKKIITIFLIVLAPIFILGIYIRNWGADTVRDELSKSSTAQIEFYLNQLEEEIERLKILQYTCLNDEHLGRLAVQYSIMSPYEIVSDMRQLQSRLTAIEYSSSYVKNVSAHIFSIDKTVSSENGVDGVDSEVYERISAAAGLKGAQIIRYEGGLYLTTVYPLDQSGQNSNYVIEVELNQDVFREDLEQFNIYPDSGSFLIDLTNWNEISAVSTGKLLQPNDILDKFSIADKSGTNLGRIGDYRYCSVYAKSDYLGMLLLRYLPENMVFMPMQIFTSWIWIFIIVSILVILIFSLFMHRYINKPIKNLVEVFRQVEHGNLQTSLNPDTVKSSEFAYLYTRFNKMVDSLNQLIDQAYKQKILTQRAELKQLQAQIKPHFLYNSFFIINTMAQLGDENLIEFTNHLGEYYRYLTRNTADIIPLCEEVEHARTYTRIQTMRFSKNLEVDFSPCPEAFEQYPVPRLIIQPLIENAFEHAVDKRMKDRKIAVSFLVCQERLHIMVEDNGKNLTDEMLLKLQKDLMVQSDDIEVTALLNINRRLKLQYDDASGVLLKRSSLGGLCAELVLGVSITRRG